MQDEICRSVADNGGIDAILLTIDNCGEQGNKTVARTCCSLLSKVQSLTYNSLAYLTGERTRLYHPVL